jgi:plastocyanin
MLNPAETTSLRGMKSNHAISSLALVLLTGALVASTPAAGAATQALVIHHQLRGCHAWSLNEGPDRVNQTVSIRAGGSITVTNDDLMPHKLVETSGRPVVYTRITMGAPMGAKKIFPPAMLARIGATSKITFSKVGVYRFTTNAGDDLMSPVATIGPDNVLHLTVRVS